MGRPLSLKCRNLSLSSSRSAWLSAAQWDPPLSLQPQSECCLAELPRILENHQGKSPRNPVCMCAKLRESCLTLCDPMEGSPPVSSVHEILQAEILEWVAMPSSRGSCWPRGWTMSLMSLRSHASADVLCTTSDPWETPENPEWLSKVKGQRVLPSNGSVHANSGECSFS